MEQHPANLYWQQFLNANPFHDQTDMYYDAFHFGSEEDAATIAALVLSGVKTSTASLAWVYAFEKKAMPGTGCYSVVTDGNGLPLCIIQTTEVNIIPFDEVDTSFALDGGEGDRTLQGWRELYWDYIQSECLRIHKTPTPKTPMVCERFTVIYKAPFIDTSNQ